MDGRPVIIGLLGGIASGKSTVARLLEDLGARVVDADRIAHELLGEPEVAAEIGAALGAEVLAAGGKPDRARIGSVVFADRERRQVLEGILHPRILERMRREIAEAGDAEAVVVDAPLLVEGGLGDLADVLVFVDAPEPERRRRAAERGWAPDELARREAEQLEPEKKRLLAAHTVVNDGSPEELSNRVTELYRRIRAERKAEGES
jgi:dephospho-CoA kinase